MKNKNPFGYGLENDDAARRQLEALETNSAYGKTKSPLESFSVRPRAEEKLVRFFPLAFNAYIVPVGATVLIDVRPQIPFKGKLLVLSSDECTSHFDVLDMRVGNWSLFPSTEPLTSDVFLRFDKIKLEHLDPAKIAYLVESFGVDMRTAAVSERICLLVRNRGDHAGDFRAALYGVGLEP